MMQFHIGHTRNNFVSHTSREPTFIDNLEKISKRIHSKLSVTYHNFYFSDVTYFTEF